MLIVSGSMRKNGNTQRACELLAQKTAVQAARAGMKLEAEVLCLADWRVQMCRGCRSCFMKGEDTCPLKDDMGAIREKIRRADCLVLASPVYLDSVSGALKNFMDRMVYAAHRPEFALKASAMLCTTGSTPAGGALKAMRVPLMVWGFELGPKAWLALGARASDQELIAACGAPLDRLAGGLVKAMRRCALGKPSFLSLFIFKIQQSAWRRKAEDGSADYGFWKGRGLLERGVSYLVPHRSFPLKTALARAAGAVAGAFL
jgi:multimeric flavodoxin WrbA